MHDVSVISIHKDVNFKKCHKTNLISGNIYNPLATTCEHYRVYYQSDTKTDTSMQEEALGKARMI